MNITLNIQAETPEEIMAAVMKLAATGGAVPAMTTPESKKTASRVNKPAAAKPAEPDSAPADTKETVKPEEPQQDHDSDQEIPDVTALRAAAREKGKTPEGKKAIKALLTNFESKSISDIPEDKRSAFLAALEEL